MNHAAFVLPSTLDLIFEMGEKQAKEYEYRPILVAGNKKIGHVGPQGVMFLTRGISYWSCPGKTEGPGGCANGCYAHFMSHLNLARGSDIGAGYTYMAFKDIDRLERLIGRDLQGYANYPSKIFVRVHDAGDFISPEHVKMYYRLAVRFPNVQFWGMSHSFAIPKIRLQLVRLNRLPNVFIRESTDPVRQDGLGIAEPFHYDTKQKVVVGCNASRHWASPPSCARLNSSARSARRSFVQPPAWSARSAGPSPTGPSRATNTNYPERTCYEPLCNPLG
jgi:hypothetical protein